MSKDFREIVTKGTESSEGLCALNKMLEVNELCPLVSSSQSLVNEMISTGQEEESISVCSNFDPNLSQLQYYETETSEGLSLYSSQTGPETHRCMYFVVKERYHNGNYYDKYGRYCGFFDNGIFRSFHHYNQQDPNTTRFLGVNCNSLDGYSYVPPEEEREDYYEEEVEEEGIEEEKECSSETESMYTPEHIQDSMSRDFSQTGGDSELYNGYDEQEIYPESTSNLFESWNKQPEVVVPQVCVFPKMEDRRISGGPIGGAVSFLQYTKKELESVYRILLQSIYFNLPCVCQEKMLLQGVPLVYYSPHLEHFGGGVDSSRLEERREELEQSEQDEGVGRKRLSQVILDSSELGGVPDDRLPCVEGAYPDERLRPREKEECIASSHVSGFQDSELKCLGIKKIKLDQDETFYSIDQPSDNSSDDGSNSLIIIKGPFVI